VFEACGDGGSDMCEKELKHKINEDYPVRPDKSLKFYEPGAAPQYLTYLCNDSSISNPWDGYSLAYLHAAKAVFQSIQNDPTLPNTIGYSFFYLYRHYLELQIKGLIRSGYAFFGETAECPIWHDLIKLWDIHCEPLLSRVTVFEVGCIPPETRENFDTVRYYLNQVMIYDPRGDAFRYPCDRNGNPHFGDSSVKTLNTKTFAIAMEWISFFLEGESTRIYELHQGELRQQAENPTFFE